MVINLEFNVCLVDVDDFLYLQSANQWASATWSISTGCPDSNYSYLALLDFNEKVRGSK